MSKIFLAVCIMSLKASAAAAIILLVRLCFRRAPRKYAYWLWGAMLVRLLCPVLSKVRLSFIPSGRALAGTGGFPAQDAAFTQTGTMPVLPDLAAAPAHGISVISFLAAVWLAGVILLFGWQAFLFCV